MTIQDGTRLIAIEEAASPMSLVFIATFGISWVLEPWSLVIPFSSFSFLYPLIMLPLHIVPPRVVAVLRVAIELLQLFRREDGFAVFVRDARKHDREVGGIDGVVGHAEAALIVRPVI